MNLTLLAFGTGIFAGLLTGFLTGAYLTLRDHGDLIDDGLAFRALVVDLAATTSRGSTTRVGDVRGEAHVTHLRVVSDR